jgi:hypothetical protein
VRASVIGVLVLSGCRSASDVAESSYHTATAPADVRPNPGPPTTVTTASRDGAVTTSTTRPAEASASTRATPSADRIPPTADHNPAPEDKPRVESSPNPSSSQLDFPTAKPVEGKPGYVYSPFDPGKYVDVSGYTPGSKVKDPYSGKIFLVP